MPDLILTEELQTALARLLKQAVKLLGGITSNNKLLEDAVTEIIAAKKQAGVRDNSIASLTCSLKSFAAFCPKQLSAVTAADIDAWLAAGDYAPKTKKNRLVDLKNLFSWSLRRGLVDRDPTTGVESPRVPFHGAAIMPVADVEKLLHTCQKIDPALIGYLALILFGGLRAKESSRALPENVHDGIVDIGGEQTKLNVRRCFPVQPVLAAWLAVPGVEIGGKNIYNRFVAVRELAGIKLPDNGLRHTAVSCWLPILGPENTAIMHGHTVSTMMKHYASKVTKADAKAFEALRPLKELP